VITSRINLIFGYVLRPESVPSRSVAAGQHASKMQQESSVIFSIVTTRDATINDVKKALESKLEDIVYKTSLSLTDDLDARQLQTLLQLQTTGVKVNVGQFSCVIDCWISWIIYTMSVDKCMRVQ